MTTGQKDNKNTVMEVPVIGISRHRIGLDGNGITTLVAFHDCRLRCKYCINPECFGNISDCSIYTPQSLLDEIIKDDVYFRATDGGITFGGGEPGIRAEFIKNFERLCPKEWKIRLETSLQFDLQSAETLAPIVDEWIVDVKTAESESYHHYTGGDYQQVVKNLHSLIDGLGVSKDKFVIRIPIIPGYTNRNQAEGTERRFREQGFSRFDIFEYHTERPKHLVSNGKAKCELLKALREEIANANGIEYESRECSHKGDCPGNCPLCEHELKKLSDDLRNQDVNSIKVSRELIDRINNHYLEDTDSGEDMGDILPLKGDVEIPLQGMPEPPMPGEIVLPPEPPHEKVLFKECAVAGVSFHLKYDDELWDELEAGQEVALVRDRKNKYDKNAVAVALPDDYDGDPDDFDFDYILGYIPKSENEEIAKMLDMGWDEVFYTTLSTVKHHGNINDRLRISIFIQSKEPQKPETIRIFNPSLHDWIGMLRDLEERGVAHFRWGGFPVWEHNLPKVGNQIVIMHYMGRKVVAFLMRIIAKGDACIPFVKDREIVTACDDCESFVIANTIGPVIVDKSELSFLGETVFGYDYEQEIPLDVSNALKEFFHKMMWKFNENNIDSDPSIDDPSLI